MSANDRVPKPPADSGIQLRRCNTTTLPWRLYVIREDRELQIPHAACRLKREALALQAELEALAPWHDTDTWDDDTREAVLAVLNRTESAQIQRRALEIDARNREGYMR